MSERDALERLWGVANLVETTPEGLGAEALRYAAARLREVEHDDWDGQGWRGRTPSGTWSRNPACVLERMAEQEEGESDG